jgi:hypothetical protein
MYNFSEELLEKDSFFSIQAITNCQIWNQDENSGFALAKKVQIWRIRIWNSNTASRFLKASVEAIGII